MVDNVNLHSIEYNGRKLFVVDAPQYDKFYSKLRVGAWEPDTFHFLSKYLTKESVYVDVGSWIGITPCWASFLANRVIAIEPEPYCANVIKSMIKKNKIDNVELVNAAFSKSNSQDLFLIGGDGSSVSTLIPHERASKISVTGVSVATINEWCGNLDRVVKIDIEGFEFEMEREILQFSCPELTALQIALHPAALAKSFKTSWPFNRIFAAGQTMRFIRHLENVFGRTSLTGYSGVWSYLIFGILLSRKCRGTELVFVR